MTALFQGKPEAAESVFAGIEEIQGMLSQFDGPFLLGNDISIGDLAVAPFVGRIFAGPKYGEELVDLLANGKSDRTETPSRRLTSVCPPPQISSRRTLQTSSKTTSTRSSAPTKTRSSPARRGRCAPPHLAFFSFLEERARSPFSTCHPSSEQETFDEEYVMAHMKHMIEKRRAAAAAEAK